MSDYSDLISQSFGRQSAALPPVVGSIDEDPDKASRAYELAKATGAPPSAIYGDLDEFERQNKAVMASDIVANNPHLADFAQQSPLHPVIANDDWGNLDTVSQKVNAMGLPMRVLDLPRRMGEIAFEGDPLKRFREGGPLGSWLRDEDLRNHPFASAVFAGLGTPIELFFRGITGTIETGADVVSRLGTAAGAPGLGREAAAMLETEAMGLSGRGHMAAPAEAYMRARPWIENGREPLPGALPEYDAYRAKSNAADLDALKEAAADAQQSMLRERNPELFRDFIAQHTDAEIGISGEAVAALYGEKQPLPDDGLLGWVPGIADKLALARETGGDVSVPLADWLARAEPEVMQTLHDDIRVRPNGITTREAAVGAEMDAATGGPSPPPIPEEVPTIRAASALEPMFSVGDRALKLERLQSTDTGHFGPAQGFHDFQLMDEKGSPVGYVNLSEQNGGKQLVVEMISGVNGLGPRDFGPSLMRSLLRQIKAEFPNAESVTGHRVSGAREKFGTFLEDSASPVVKLDAKTLDTENFSHILDGGSWHAITTNSRAYFKPRVERSLADRQIAEAVSAELNRIVPKKLSFGGVAERIESTGARGNEGSTIQAGGLYARYKTMYPVILASLEGEDPVGSARHEAIHHLRNYGFFTPKEWSTLETAANEGGWLDKHDIHARYAKGDHALKLEEAIAEEFASWRNGSAVTPEVQTVFEKLKALFDAIRERISALLGKPVTVDDIFQRVDRGEIGSRSGTTAISPEVFDTYAQVPKDEGGPRIFERANALGMSVEQFKAYDRLIAKRHAEDIAEATKRAETEKARELTKQWKEDRKALRVEVADDIKQRPDVAADLFFGAGELYGKKVPLGSVKLDASALTDAQKAGLPRNYYGTHGFHPDDVANLFGYGSGDAMVSRLVEYNAAKLTAGGMSAKDFVSRVTDIETDRQMRIKYGVLEDNIIDAIKEHVAGETQLDILHEETHALGMKAGVAPLDKATIRDQLRQAFAKMPLGSVSSDAYFRAAGKAGRMIESGLLGDDPQAAFRAKQQQYYATVIAGEAAKLEKELGKFDKVAKRFSKREVPALDAEYTNYIHDILMRVGKPVRRSIQDLEGEIAAGEYKSLQDFVEGKNGFYLREVAVADMLFDPSFRKAFEDLTVDEFRAVDTSIKSLIANGRDEKKITKAGQAEDLAIIRGQMIEQLQQFQERQYDAKGGRWMGPVPPAIAKKLRTYGVAHIQMENLFNRWDHDNPQGVFQQYIMRDLVDAANSESAMEKRYAAKLREIDDKADLKQSIDNTLFKVPGTDQLMKLTRGNLRAILLNAGNASNLDKMARGYGLKAGEVQAWLNRYATPEDWQWAQKMGDIFAELKGEADIMYRHLSGVAPESIQLKPIDTPHGPLPGWYYPLIAHSEFEGPVKRMMGKDALEQEGFVRATTANGYTKARTGVAYPLALDLDALAPRMKQMIHDISMRPSVINASKIFYDKEVRGAISKHFGNEWRDMLIPYLSDVANSANYMPKEQRMFMQASEFIRQNVISTLVGLNPGTVLKHGPTALVQSMHEVGSVDFLKAIKGLFSVNDRTGEGNWQFAMKTSEELQRRHQNYIETLGGATDLLQPRGGFASLRSTIQRFSATPVAISDLLSAVPTWLAQYERTLAEGATHGDAVYMADRAVRRAHGSVAITNRSAVMRGGALPQWFASVYGFFNHIMNRQYELLWKSGETLGLAKDGEYREAMSRAPELTSMLFAYVLAPALIEEMVTPLISDDKESWGKKAAKGLAFTLGASWVGVRDLASAMLNGRDPSIGLISTAGKTLTDFARDFGKKEPLGKGHAGKVVRDGATLLGALTGTVPAQVGKTAQFGIGVAQGTERPKGPWGWLTGLRFGTLDKHPKTFQEWQRHHLGGH